MSSWTSLVFSINNDLQIRQEIQALWLSLNISDHLKHKYFNKVSPSAFTFYLTLKKTLVLTAGVKLTSSIWFTLVRYWVMNLVYNEKSITKTTCQTKQYRVANSVVGLWASGPSCEWLRDRSMLTHQGPRWPQRWGIFLFTVVSVVLCVAALELPVPPGSPSLHCC